MIEHHRPDLGQRVPVRVWSSRAPRDAVAQLVAVASQPWACDHVAGMADLHVASSIAVGTVFATEHHVVPSALGDDLGCGVCALPTSLSASRLDRRALQRLVLRASREIPMGDVVRRDPCDRPTGVFAEALSTHALSRWRDRYAARCLGTLGGGNHFLELDRDAEGRLWLLAHSGSRGLGGAVAAHHRKAAEAEGVGDPRALDLRTPAGRRCLDDLAVAQRFARDNRLALMAALVELVGDALGDAPDLSGCLDVPHNFVARESFAQGERVVHRKGAAPAHEGAAVVLPGSMGTATWIARGRGDVASFASCSHGAGRVMTRTEARRRIDARALASAMHGVVYDPARADAMRAEAPAAYRDIAEVIDEQRDLVTPVLRLEPIAVMKG